MSRCGLCGLPDASMRGVEGPGGFVHPECWAQYVREFEELEAERLDTLEKDS